MSGDSTRGRRPKYIFPLFKKCESCGGQFEVFNRAQVVRNKTCSPLCAGAMISRAKKGHLMPIEKRKGRFLKCPTCGVDFWRVQSRILLAKLPVCSRRCGSILRGRELVKHSYKGRAGWTSETLKGFRLKMTGSNNPAWKGGVTYFKTHGNYVGVKYVRCPDDFREMARKDGYVMEHRLLVAKAIGRCLTRREVVHHEDHNPRNNTMENLALFDSNSDHKLYEHYGTPLPTWKGSAA